MTSFNPSRVFARSGMMSIKTVLVAVVCTVAVCVLVLSMYPDMRPRGTVKTGTDTWKDRLSYRDSEPGVSKSVVADLIRQRNNISRQLNLKQQKLGQLECEKSSVSLTGGWCASASKEDGGQHVTDKNLASTLATLFEGKYVASFGDGPGRYKQLLLDTGKLKGCDSYDGAPFSETTSDGRVKFLDLTLPQYGLPLYDWVMSLEVAEHIPAQYEAVFVDNIVRHAREGIVLSWAEIGQGGYYHVNNKALEDVIALFDKLGFSHDEAASKKIQDGASVGWLKANTHVYMRRDPATIEAKKVLYV